MQKSGTRKEELLLRAKTSTASGAAQGARPALGVEAMELLLDKMGKTKSNQDFLSSMQKMG